MRAVYPSIAAAPMRQRTDLMGHVPTSRSTRVLGMGAVQIFGDPSRSTHRLSKQPIRTAPAVYSVASSTYVALQGPGVSCPTPASDHQLTVLKIGVRDRPTITQTWCGKVSGAGSPIVTTSGGGSDPIVWMVGAEGDNRLHGFKGDTGEPFFPAGVGPAMAGLRHFQTLIATRDRLYVGANDRIYAFAF
jgi:hypothetical protein